MELSRTGFRHQCQKWGKSTKKRKRNPLRSFSITLETSAGESRHCYSDDLRASAHDTSRAPFLVNHGDRSRRGNIQKRFQTTPLFRKLTLSDVRQIAFQKLFLLCLVAFSFYRTTFRQEHACAFNGKTITKNKIRERNSDTNGLDINWKFRFFNQMPHRGGGE